jgi:hypothetical protein
MNGWAIVNASFRDCATFAFFARHNFNRPLSRSSTPNCHWPHGWDFAGERARPGGRFRRRTASPENSPAIHGWDSMPAIVQSPARDERIFLPSLVGLLYLINALPSHEWLGYCPRLAPRLRRLRDLRATKIQTLFAPFVQPKLFVSGVRPTGTN